MELIALMVNAIPDAVRFSIMPVLRIVAHLFGVPLFEDGTFDI